LRHWCPPIDEQRIVIIVEESDTADVERRSVFRVDPAETQSALDGHQLGRTTRVGPGEGIAFARRLVGASRRACVDQSEFGGRAVAGVVQHLVQHRHIALFCSDLVPQHAFGHALSLVLGQWT
jgi:hypothetical protein